MILQDQINEKCVSMIYRGSQMTAQIFGQCVKELYEKMSKVRISTTPPPGYQGKQSVKNLVGQGAGVTNIEITDANIKCFERYAKKYGIDYALKKDATENPPKWLVFFKARDADALNAAFKEFTSDVTKRENQKKPSIIAALKKAQELAASLVSDKVKNKDRGIEL